jgi:hypothetical protein
MALRDALMAHDELQDALTAFQYESSVVGRKIVSYGQRLGAGLL